VPSSRNTLEYDEQPACGTLVMTVSNSLWVIANLARPGRRRL
jgi:hypothetical protein